MKHPQDVDVLVEASEALEVPISPSQAQLLLRFESLLADQAIRYGMVASSDAHRLRQRHVLDCLRAAGELGDAETAYDLGSGAGLPGLVIAIAAPHLRVSLVESRRRRASFLEAAVDDLQLENVEVLGRPVDTLTERVDRCFARAFAPIAVAWKVAEPLLRARGRIVYFAGMRTSPQAPAGARILAVRSTAVLESAGPLVIMGRQ